MADLLAHRLTAGATGAGDARGLRVRGSVEELPLAPRRDSVTPDASRGGGARHVARSLRGQLAVSDGGGGDGDAPGALGVRRGAALLLAGNAATRPQVNARGLPTRCSSPRRRGPERHRPLAILSIRCGPFEHDVSTGERAYGAGRRGAARSEERRVGKECR